MLDELDDLFAGVFGDDASPDEPELAEPPPAAATEQDTPPAVEQPASEPKVTAEAASEDDVMAALDGFMGDSGLQTEDEKSAVDLTQPWMAHHHFVLVRTVDEVRELVDKAIENGACSLDLETEGFDNRIDYDEQDRPYTRHKIVGYCISVRGVGHYIPIRHKFAADMGQSNPNVTPLADVEAEVTRLCLAAQPELTEEGKEEDPLGSSKIAVPPKVIIYFWHAKFDQEYLYPVTGIDYWHWMSFECGNLAAYCVYSDDKNLGLKAKSRQKLWVYPDKSDAYHEYQMIAFKDLFPQGMKPKAMHFDELTPDPGSAPLMYACSDAICTELICEARKVEWDYAVEPDRVEYKEVISPATTDRRFKGTYRLEKQTVQAVRLMERTRMLIDMGEIDKLIEEAEAELKIIDEEFQGQAELKGFKGFNPGSPEQVGEFLFSERGLDINPKPEKTEDGQYKTDAGTLEKIADKTELEIIRLVIKRRQIVKIIGTYLKGMHKSIDENNRLRFNLKQTGAVTGRFTAPKGREDHGFAAIPIQGIPARDDPKKPKVAQSLRRLFISSLGYAFIKIDYSGQELRIVANLSKEPVWKKEFMEGSGDLHTLTAQAFFGAHITKADKLERNMAKCVHPDTLVEADFRLRPISSLGDFPTTPDTFVDVDPISVWGADQFGVLRAVYNGGVKPLVHVVISGGVVTCSENHRFKMRDGEFVRAADLRKGMLLHEVEIGPWADGGPPHLTVKTSLWKGVPEATFETGPDLAYFAGAFAGDGTGSRCSASLTHGESEKLDVYGNPYEDWIRVLKEACGRCGLTTSRKDATSLYLGSTVFVRYLRAMGLARKRSKKLRIPAWVLDGGKVVALNYLAGLFDTDGTVDLQYNGISWTTKDFIFAGQVAMVAKSCGLSFNTETSYNKTYDRHYLRLRFTVASSWQMRHFMRHAGKLGRLREPLKQGRTKDRFEIVQVLPAGEGPCLDITVDTEHVYLANGFLTHNSANFAMIYGGGVQAIMRATKCDKVEAARKKSAFDQSVPTFAKWVKRQHKSVKDKLGVFNGFGRFIRMPDANIKVGDIDSNGKMATDGGRVRMIRASCERNSTNYPVQGCLDFNSLVLTKKGWKAIGELERSCEGFTVWTGTRWAEASAHGMGECELADIVLSDGTIIHGDIRHKLLVVSQQGYDWVEYPDLEPGMAVATSICEPLEMEPPLLPPMGQRERSRMRPEIAPSMVSDLWYWLGRYVGDGWIDPRGAIVFCFGAHEREAIERCKTFWSEVGLNPKEAEGTHTPAQKTSTRYRVEVWSVDLADWLQKLGVEHATAHTKRCPHRIHCETLEHRQAFLRGVMDSDGHKPKLPRKVDGVWETKLKGNPYNIHLCQRPLLEDLKRVLRTVGVESVLRGPYQEGTSYRLDLNRRMFERNVMGRDDVRHPKFHDMFAPKFMVDAFLAQGPFQRPAFEGDDSAYTLYLRLKKGGRVTVYTLKRLCQLLGKELEQPFYGFKCIIAKERLGQSEQTYTLTVYNPLHRFEADGVITKNSGADILKIAMVQLTKFLSKKGWLKNGGDDSVRMMLTVHDEIVFEIKYERLQEALPLICHIMERPSTMAKWEIPLVVEADVDLCWAAKHDGLGMLAGTKPIPEWLEGYITPGAPPPEMPEAPQPATKPASPQPPAQPTAAPKAAAPPQEVSSSTPQKPPEPKSNGVTHVVTFRVHSNYLTRESIRLVQKAIAGARPLGPEHGESRFKLLRLLDEDGDTLIGTELSIHVDPDQFARELRHRNMGKGSYTTHENL